MCGSGVITDSFEQFTGSSNLSYFDKKKGSSPGHKLKSDETWLAKAGRKKIRI
ncbi:hypothetical protein HanXRQr2_Chr05g0221951 [Helianthus annuus]|uniref:Uncharacterized protein n=1 Tax=Helianthus annuus TaxID=4232 RepID=A0A9K3J108_HELAN|nr:hypothetical protein HanXRQr2_Chr05g0221951 [Helianthus annuus]KAJ0570741.1 hypothetical protein HanHA300_Chr05g0181591 [Helianthus annuus]KAJ0577676.1 hypothetical protein HanIR_Chr05g0238761 [Helianthus annuus]KAJ0585082.1 hypothetical protein HanHA89_Chr05g0196271 [Helianthus annuus]